MNKDFTDQVLLADREEIANRAEFDLSELNGHSILISGGTGFVGKWLLTAFLGAKRLLGFEFNLTLISRNPKKFLDTYPQFRSLKIRFIETDIAFLSAEKITDLKVDFLIHAATDVASNPLNTKIDKSLKTGIDGTLNVVRSAINHGCRRIINLSSGAVYGSQPIELDCITESFCGSPDLADPRTAYHQIKRLGEFLANSEATNSGAEVVTARLFTFIGPYLPSDAQFAAGNFIDAARRGVPIEINGDGSPIRTFQYPVDAIVALLAILVRGKPNSAYNVGSSEEISILDFAKRITLLAGLDSGPIVHGVTQTNLAGSRYVPCIKKIEQELQFSNEIDLENSILRSLSW